MEAVITTVGGAILSASFQALFNELGKQDFLTYARDGHVENEVNTWRSNLEIIYEVLEDAEEKQMVDHSVEKWFSELRDLAYDVEDIVDEFATNQALRLRRLEDEEAVASTSNVRKFIPTCCATPNFNLTKFKFNAEMVKRMKGITCRLDDITKRKNKLGLTNGGRGKKANQKLVRNPMTCVPEEKETQIYGREEDKKKMLQLLNSEAAGGVDVSVVAIVGLGGIGKTTLAQLLYNNADFDCKAWAPVGTEAFDVRGVTRSILRCLGPNTTNIEKDDLTWLQTELKKELHQKKCLIVLDDVWYEAQFYSHWRQFRGPLLGWSPESRIIVTTRHERVSSMMGAMSCYSLEQLSQDDFLSVLAQHALGVNNFNGHPHLREIGDQIASRCKGLPLAAKTLGGLLTGTPHFKAWEDVLNSNIWDSRCEILPALMLSYIHLPSHLKQCFAYFAVFPKDFEFDRNELALLWMAEGFVSGKHGAIHDLGCKYFDELLSRSLLQQSSSNKSLYVMHDLIHDLAQYVSRGMCFHSGDKLEDGISFTKIRHSSFFSGKYDTFQKFGDLSKMQSLRTFIALSSMETFRFTRLSSKVVHEVVPELRFLRVLSLAGYNIEELPSSIGGLTHLRYLNLSGSKIRRLPEEVAELFNLQTLILYGCNKLRELPSRMGNLINLYFLDISFCYLPKLPHGISNLINLHCLKMSRCLQLNKLPAQIGKLWLGDFYVDKESGVNLTELKSLSKLQGKLCIKNLQDVVDIGDAYYANLKEKDGIEELELEWTHGFSGSRNNILSTEVGVLKLLRPPHQKLSSLSIESFGGAELPSWLGDPIFSKLVKLQLWNCRNVKSLPPLGQLPSLRELSLMHMHGVEVVGAELYGGGGRPSCFASLETLYIWDMEEWEQWNWSSNDTNEEAAVIRFSKLSDLKVRKCPKLVGKLPSCLPSLQNLWVEECQEALLKSMSDFTSLTTLKIEAISGLESLDDAHMEDLVSLQELDIIGCEELIYLWKDGTNLDKLAFLKRLSIGRCDQMVCLEGQLPPNLQDLHIWNCHKLRYLWKDGANLHKLDSLRILYVTRCGMVSLVEGEEGKLPCNLQSLKIYLCHKLKSLCAIPCSLRHLQVTRCKSLEIMGDGIFGSQMSQLEELIIRECPALTSSPNGQFPTSLVRIEFNECSSLPAQLLAPPNGFSHLTHLQIESCPQLVSFPEITSSSTLTFLSICCCENLRSLPDQMHNLSSLQSLEIHGCNNLRSLPDQMHKLASLQSLKISWCNNLRSLPDRTPNLFSLQSLEIDGCNNLRSLPNGMSSLSSLQYLEIKNCDSFESFGEGGLPTNLCHLLMRNFKNMTQPVSEWGLHSLTSLTHLQIHNTLPGTDTVISFPEDDLQLPNSITHLNISHFNNLKSISRPILRLTSLIWLAISNCPKVQSFPKDSILPSLQQLIIWDCPLLEKWCSEHTTEHSSFIFPIPCVDCLVYDNGYLPNFNGTRTID